MVCTAAHKRPIPRYSLSSQVIAEGVPKYGEIGQCWAKVAATLSLDEAFHICGGVKADNCKKQFNEMLTEHRVKVKNGEFTSGTRDGDDDEIVDGLNTYAEEEDEIQGKRDAVTQEGIANNNRKEARAAEVSFFFLRSVFI